MIDRVGFALLAGLLLWVPAVAGAQEEDEEGGGDLDSLMSGDPEEGDDGDDEGEGEEGEEGESADGFSDEEEEQPDFDAIEGMDDERPPGDPDAFITPEEEEPEEAEPEEDPGKPFSVGLLVGYGISLEDTNPWGFGLGARLGYDLGLISLGAEFAYFFGESVDFQDRDPFGNPLGPAESITINLWQIGLHGGLDLDVSDDVTIRPGLGVGFATVSTASASEANVYISPGAALLYAASESMYLGLDARYQAIAADTTRSGILILVTTGLQF